MTSGIQKETLDNLSHNKFVPPNTVLVCLFGRPSPTSIDEELGRVDTAGTPVKDTSMFLRGYLTRPLLHKVSYYVKAVGASEVLSIKTWKFLGH